MARSAMIVLLAAALVLACGPGRQAEEAGFEPLFNGQDLAGWAPAEGFRVEDGCIVSAGEGAGNLFTARDYGNYILRLEFLLSKVGNSGIVLRANPDSAWQTGFEVQLLAPWTPYRDDLHCTGSLYGLVAVTDRPDETTGVWHSLEVVCDRYQVITAVDGRTVAWGRYDRVAGLGRKNLRGRIGLQGNHSAPTEKVSFRHIRLRELDRAPGYVAAGLGLPQPELRGQAYAAALQVGAPMAPALCAAICSGDSVGASAARQALFAIAAGASAPGAAAGGRDSLLGLLRATAADTLTGPADRGWLEWLAGMLEAH